MRTAVSVVLLILVHVSILFALEETGFIYGSVLESATDQPLRDVKVRIYTTERICPLYEIQSDENGYFQFTGLSPGRYRVTATTAGFERQAYGQDKENPAGRELLITAASPMYELDFRLPRGTSVSGHVYKIGGAPLIRSYVFLQSLSDPNRAFHTFTDEIGFYSVDDLPADYYTISAQEFALSSKQLTGYRWYYPGTVHESAATPIQLEADKNAAVDIYFQEDPKPAWTMKVTNLEGQPVAKADLAYFKTGTNPPASIFACRTGTDGTCGVRQIQPGDYRVYVQSAPPPYVFWMNPDNAAEKDSALMYAKQIQVIEGVSGITEFQLETGKRVIIHLNGLMNESDINFTFNHDWDLGRVRFPLSTRAVKISLEELEVYLHPSLEYRVTTVEGRNDNTYVATKASWNGTPMEHSNLIQLNEVTDPRMEFWLEPSASLSGTSTAKRLFLTRTDNESVTRLLYPSSLFVQTVKDGLFLFSGIPAGIYQIHKDRKDGPFVEITLKPGESKTVAVE